MNSYSLRTSGLAHACNCIGPQPGQPLCPCSMKGLIQRNGRWIRPEQDLGPVVDQPTIPNRFGDLPGTTQAERERYDLG